MLLEIQAAGRGRRNLQPRIAEDFDGFCMFHETLCFEAQKHALVTPSLKLCDCVL